ncbi:TPR repeat protein [Paucibacter oligotrophus]|uniref:TPR repeat protein n=1 Tax=Roseateles oligotrophus TaxID=1769250 RepID=A0A840LCU6_9BURK|nr:tetratricopeptide repeat protein [Roseateles oligotrophus]MBB4845986.1 TPR repeat protein [Roseateles oligotrophus]
MSAFSAEANSSEAQLFTRLSALAASGGNAEVKYNLGMFLNNGIGTARDNAAAFRMFKEAAEAGHKLAAYKLGCYLAGQFPGTVPVDQEEALKYKLRAAEAGYELAQFDVGMLYAQKRDIETALLWWERASRQGHFPATAYLASYLSREDSTELVKALAVLRVARDLAPKTSAELLGRLAKLEEKLGAADKAAAQALYAGWLGDKTALTQQAKLGISALPALLDALER